MSYPIEIESETLQFDGEWYTREELARYIKRQLDENDFAVGRPAAALEHLVQTIASLRTLALRVLPEMHERLTHEAARQGRPVGAVVRDAIAAYLGIPTDQPGPLRAAHTLPPAGRRPTDPEMPGLADTQLMEMPPMIDDVHGSAEPQAPENGTPRSVVVDFSRLEGEAAKVPNGRGH